MAVIKKESHQTWIGTAAEMALFTSMLAGDKFITTDTKLEYEYTGAAWIIKSTGVQLSGSNVAEMQDQSDATEDVLTFAANITSIEIYHSEATPQIFTVNGLTLIVAAGGWRSPIAGTPGKTVGIPTGVNCIVARLV